MISGLQVKNFATIDDLAISFQSGFTALTGETGAGKSILLDALGLLLGERADLGLIRSGEEQAEISVNLQVDSHEDIAEWFNQEMIEFQGELSIRRVIRMDGRSKAFVNGVLTSIGSLNRLGDYLVDIQGQHAQQLLFKKPYQRQLLDRYADLSGKVRTLEKLYQDWRAKTEELEHYHQSRANARQQMDLLQLQLSDFNKVHPQSNEFEEMMQKFEKLTHLSDRMFYANEALSMLRDAGNDPLAASDSVLTLLQKVEKSLTELARFEPAANDTLEQLHSILPEVSDIAEQCQAFGVVDDLDPAQHKYYEERLSDFNHLAKKYNHDINHLEEKHREIENSIAQLDTSHDREAELAARVAQVKENYDAMAADISAVRTEYAGVLASRILEILPDLGMPHAKLEIQLQPLEKPTAYGLEQIEYLISTNPGMPLRPLGKVASGGELSRISLAIQVCLSKNLQTPTIIFDEVDVGIGGGMAQVVGSKMRQLGEWVQVLCVTHQGQAAAKAHHQHIVYKHQDVNTTNTMVRPLEGDERVREIARMIGGQDITDASLTHAQELLVV